MQMTKYEPVATPFIVVENSSGSGKTQMAFNLHATGQCDVFYVLCTSQLDRQQTVYGAFKARTATFRTCIKKDAIKLGDEKGSVADFTGFQSLHVYSFIVAALRGMNEISGLEARRYDVTRALEDRRKKTKKPFVFFLDEFPRVGNRKGYEKTKLKKQARMMRNVFRSFRIIAVASATNGTARDLVSFSKSSRGFSSSGEPIPWCEVVPSLPAFQASMSLDPSFLWIIKHSRPLFAHRAEVYMARNPFERSGKDRLEYLTDMTKELVKTFRQLRERSAEGEFELGQFCMLLCSSYKSTDDVNLIDGHYGCLEERTPFTLVLDIRDELDPNATGLSKLVPGGREPWSFCCRFPLPEEDLLLHLTLMSDHCFPADGGNAANTTVRPLRLPVYNEWRQFNVPYHCYNTNQKTNDGMALEALVAAAVVLASHRGGYYGVKFPDFLGRLLYELGVEDDVNCVKHLPDQLKQDTVIPFLSMPNTEWPVEFLECWRDSGAMFANMIRATNKDQVDFMVPSNKKDGETSLSDERKGHEVPPQAVQGDMFLSGECKDREALSLGTLKQILKRVPKKTNIHLVTVQVLQQHYFTADSTKKLTPDMQSAQSGVMTMASSQAPDEKSKPMSASEYLKQVDLQHADFYRISRSGGVQEFEELMGAKDAGVGVRETGAGKLILFVEVGTITKKRGVGKGAPAKSAKQRKLTR
ncbi:hypothetical protein PHYBOEH_010923 [Phytophthora boehmeriae]|uniref:Crinkler (CRN) family protein n=1 Tax=Phytophthora boehmeriae TaxID=109152 RepID=A0A8T1VJV9_9STRA|nr:hypothetical protein PHYBOEH_010923 [Phytophthora boehmeriae]